MRKIILLLLLIPALAFGQTELPDMTEDTSPGSDSLYYSVDDPSGTPADRKVTGANLLGTKSISIVLTSTATASTDFLVGRIPRTIQVTNVHCVALSGTLSGQFEECNSSGASCTVIDADISCDGGLDSDDGSLSNDSIDAGDWIKWHTTSVSSPGYTTITLYYKYND